MSRQHSWHAHLRRFAFTSLLLLGVATSAFAQFDRGTITGTVKDAQGGIVPGVTVTLTSTQTQQVRSTVTDGSGFYTFPNLTAGRYEISAELSGFKKISRSNVQLDAAGALSLDFTLETGALTEEVTVTAENDGAADAGRGSQSRSKPRTSSCCRSRAATRSASPRSRPASSAATSTTPASRR